jgi:hypothetical protein
MDLPTFLRYRKNKSFAHQQHGGGGQKQQRHDGQASTRNPLETQSAEAFARALFGEIQTVSKSTHERDAVRQHACALWGFVREHGGGDVMLTQSFQSFCEALEKVDPKRGIDDKLLTYIDPERVNVFYSPGRWSSERIVEAAVVPSLKALNDNAHLLRATCSYDEVKFATDLTRSDIFQTLGASFRESVAKLAPQNMEASNKPLFVVGYSVFGVHALWRGAQGDMWVAWDNQSSASKTQIAFTPEYTIPRELGELDAEMPFMGLQSGYMITTDQEAAYQRGLQEHIMMLKTPQDAANNPRAPVLVLIGDMCAVDACPEDLTRTHMTWRHIAPVQVSNVKLPTVDANAPLQTCVFGIPTDVESKPLAYKHYSKQVFYPTQCYMIAYEDSTCPPIVVQHPVPGRECDLDAVYVACLDKLRHALKVGTCFNLWEPSLDTTVMDAFAKKTRTKDLDLYVKEWVRQIEETPAYTKAFKEVCKNIGSVLMETRDIQKVEEELEEYEFMTETDKANAFFLDRHYKAEVMSTLFSNPYFVHYLMYDKHDVRAAQRALEYYKSNNKLIHII